MPWSERKKSELREEFASVYEAGKTNMATLCREYGISRKTGYKWLERYRAGEELGDHPRRPVNGPNKTPVETERAILEIREKHPAWGARKIQRLLQNRGESVPPSISTVGNILRRNDLISPQASARSRPHKRFARKNPNELWQMDFKGDFLLENGKRCYPLTLLDDCSRYSLCLEAMPNQRWEGVKCKLTGLFEQYGLPDTILSDNGPPWGNGQSHGMTRFEVWMMMLDILPIHGRALHPQTQGKEERFHRTMDEELLSIIELKDLRHAQREFDCFRETYNTQRPHEALGMDFPCDHYNSSPRCLPRKLEEPEYEENALICQVSGKGVARLNGREYYIGAPLSGHWILAEELPDDLLRFRFGNFEIARFHFVENRFVSRRISRLCS